MQFYNPTLEDFKWQCNGRIYHFNKRSVVEVEDNAVPFIEEQCGHRGVFALKYGIDFQKAERNALIRYLNETLSVRIQNYKDYKQQLLMTRNVTIEDPVELKRALRWKQELIDLLEQQAPIEVEYSYLDEERRKRLQIDNKNVIQFTEKPNLQEVSKRNIFAGFSQAEISNGFNLTDNDTSYVKKEAPRSSAPIEAPKAPFNHEQDEASKRQRRQA